MTTFKVVGRGPHSVTTFLLSLRNVVTDDQISCSECSIEEKGKCYIGTCFKCLNVFSSNMSHSYTQVSFGNNILVYTH